MTEYWEKSTVTGWDDEKKEHREVLLHRRGEDPVVMACRRNRELAGCSRIRTETAEAFLEIRGEREYGGYVKIGRDVGERFEEWSW